MTEGNGPDERAQRPKLSPSYKPAEEDSRIIITLNGNTSSISDIVLQGIDAFQLLAVGEYLKMKGLQTIAMQESEMARQLSQKSGIAVAGKIPDDLPRPGG
jgi:hypothetical protein